MGDRAAGIVTAAFRPGGFAALTPANRSTEIYGFAGAAAAVAVYFE